MIGRVDVKSWHSDEGGRQHRGYKYYIGVIDLTSPSYVRILGISSEGRQDKTPQTYYIPWHNVLLITEES